MRAYLVGEKAAKAVSPIDVLVHVPSTVQLRAHDRANRRIVFDCLRVYRSTRYETLVLD